MKTCELTEDEMSERAANAIADLMIVDAWLRGADE